MSSGKILVIVESPAKCKKIESYLGSEYKCVASFGHIRELMTDKGIKCIEIENNYNPLFRIVQRQQKHISELRKLIALSKEVLLATDDDREGEAIAWHICVVFGLPIKLTKRIIFHEITKPAMLKAVSRPTVIDMKKVESQKARQVLDLLVGFTISPVLMKCIPRDSFKQSLSAGRCQTPALRLVYDNHLEIERNPGKELYTISGYFTKMNLQYKYDSTIERKEDVENFLERSVSHNYVMENKQPELVKKSPGNPLTTSAIQQKASNDLHYSPKDTMKICQNLYEAGYITYMRTDSIYFSKEFLKKIQEFIDNKYGKTYIMKDLFDKRSLPKDDDCDNDENSSDDNDDNNDEDKDRKPKKKILKIKKKDGTVIKSKKAKKSKKDGTAKKKNENNAQEAHEAIRPTNITLTELTDQHTNEKIGKREVKMYKLIWNYTMESCMADAECSKLLSTITAPASTSTPSSTSTIQKNYYKYICEKVIFPGWKIIRGYDKECPEYEFLLSLNTKNPKLTYNKITAEYTLHELKSHYTEAKLISLLEKKGIGRPSTYSTIISKIQEREYVKKENIPGRKVSCIDYELIGNEIEEIEQEKTIGGEKNKMKIQPLGIKVIEFLIKNYNEVFDYEYTKRMEDELDNIANNKKVWHTLCDECYKSITNLSPETEELISNLKTENNKQSKEKYDRIKREIEDSIIKIDDIHSYRIAKYGPVVFKEEISSKTKKKKTIFMKAKDGLNPDDIRSGKLKLEDILYIKKERDTPTSSNYIGNYNNNDIYLKYGKFGAYVTYGTKNVSIKWLDKVKNSRVEINNIDDLLKLDIVLEDVVPYVERKQNVSDVGADKDAGAGKDAGTVTGIYTKSTKSTKNTKSIKTNKEVSKNINISDNNNNKQLLRIISDELSIRNGKFGNYVFYKTSKMKNPKFISIKDYKGDIMNDDLDIIKEWLKEKL
jgi:DNA topoisomerase I